MTTTFDAIQKPKHYNSHPSGLEAIEICEKIGFNCGAAFKYLFRYKLKENPVQDLKKACWYLKREIAIITNEYTTVAPLPEPLRGDYGVEFFDCCLDDVAALAVLVLEHEDSWISGAMAHLIRGSELMSDVELAIAIHYIERQIDVLS